MLTTIAPTFSIAANEEEIKELQKKLDQLEAKQSELSRKLEEKTPTKIINKVIDRFSISGLIEIEAGGEDNNQSGDASSDIVLATFELGLNAEINDKTTGHVLLLWEDGDNSVHLDEGYIQIESPSGLSLKAGKLYIPFGNFESHFISDPLTLELGETNKSTIILTYATDLFKVAVGGFNGDVDKTGDNKVDDFVASLTLNLSDNFSIGASYLSDLSDTDAEITGLTTIKGDTAGVSGFVNISLGDINLIAKYLGAHVDFDLPDLDQNADGKNEKPSVYNIELAYAISDSLEIAIKSEASNDLGDGTDIPEEQYGMAISYLLAENTNLSFEYMDSRFEEMGIDKNGNPDNRDRQLYTSQLSIEF